MRSDDRSAGDDEGAIERAIGDVGDIDHHAEAVHLVHDVFAEFAEALLGVRDRCVVDVAGGVGPAIGVGPGERHVAHAKRVELAQQCKRVFDGVAAFNAHERGYLVLAMCEFDSLRRSHEHHFVLVLRDLLLDGVNQDERAAREVALVRHGIDPDGEKLRAEIALFGGFEVPVAAVERIAKVVVLDLRSAAACRHACR